VTDTVVLALRVATACKQQRRRAPRTSLAPAILEGSLTDRSINERLPVRAGAVQLNSTEDTDRNLATADRLVREAAAAGAELVILPEKWNVLGRAEVMAAAAEPLDGPALTWAAGAARELGIDLVAGSIVERVSGQERTANTSVHFTKTGRQSAYRKLHMFDVEVDGVVYAESAHEQPGDEVVVSELADGSKLGMSICYDVRFPELYRELSARGAEIIAVPAAFTLATTRDHWEVLLRARAIENQCFVVAPNQVGSYPPGNRSGGRSMIVDPWGLVLACAPDTECVIVAELDFDNLRGIRQRLPALQHRRPEIYERAAV
jgi:predicted amidohydrolase